MKDPGGQSTIISKPIMIVNTQRNSINRMHISIISLLVSKWKKDIASKMESLIISMLVAIRIYKGCDNFDLSMLGYKQSNSEYQ